MEIYFESERASLRITWLVGNDHLSIAEYIEYWYLIQRHVEVLKPVVLLIDAEQLEYRSVPEVQEIFNRISELINPQNFAIIISKEVLGQKNHEKLAGKMPDKRP